MKNILIVDDHQIVRDGIRYNFKNDEEFRIEDEASTGNEALKLLEKKDYDIVLTDISMPEMTGMDFLEALRERYPDQKVLVLSMHDELPYINKMIAKGANGYVLKKSTKVELVEAINRVLEGQDYYSEEVYKTIIDGIAARPKEKKRLTLEKELTDREKEVLLLIVQEFSNQEIADKLFISVRTVETHKRNLLEKTGCKNVAGLAMYAVERKMI